MAAAKIERVEKEFILGAAVEEGTTARLQAEGRTLHCRLVGAGKEFISFVPPAASPDLFKAWESVSVYFDFRGQGVAFSSPVKKAARDRLDLAVPDTMYRSLARRWPRVAAPRGFCADLLLPDLGLKLECPECREYTEVEAPQGMSSVQAKTLQDLVAAFKEKAAEYSSESRVVMWKEGRGPADAVETLVARLGRILYVPSTLSGLPLADPYPEGRIVTRAALEEYEGFASLVGDSQVEACLAERSRAGLAAGLWCPILYYRYAVGFVYLGNDGASRKPFDLRAVDFAWEFARGLAWFLKTYAYFEAGAGAEAGHGRSGAACRETLPCRGNVVDASPSGALITFAGRAPRLKPGVSAEVLLSCAGRSFSCRARVMRRFERDGASYYGLSFAGIAEESRLALADCLYGASGPRGPLAGA